MCRHYTPWDVSRSESQSREPAEDEADSEDAEDREVDPILGDD